MSRPFSLAMLPMANRIAETRRQLQVHLEAAESATGDDIDNPSAIPMLCISIDGSRMDAAMVAAAKPAIVGELRGRIASLERDLAAMGVAV